MNELTQKNAELGRFLFCERYTIQPVKNSLYIAEGQDLKRGAVVDVNGVLVGTNSLTPYAVLENDCDTRAKGAFASVFVKGEFNFDKLFFADGLSKEDLDNIVYNGSGLGIVIKPYEYAEDFSPLMSPSINNPLMTKNETARMINDAVSEVTLDPSAVAFGNAHLLDEVTEFAADAGIIVDSETNGPGFMEAPKLLELTSQNALAGNVAPAFAPNSTTTIAGQPYMYEGSLYLAKEAYQGAWDASKFVSVSVKDLLNTIYYDYNTAIFNIPRNQLPSIEKDGYSFVIKFPLGTGADAGKMYLFSSSKDTITMDYSSNVSDGVYKVTLATNESLVYDFKTNSFLKKYFVTSQYKGDYYLIAANSSGTLYGPITKYYNPLRIDALEKEVLSPNTFQLWGNYGFLYGMQTSGYGAPIGTTSVNRYSDFIPVKKGDVVIANTCIGNSGLAIAFYTSNDFDTIVGGVLGRDNTKLEKYIYVCPADGYISGSTSTYAYADALNATIQITTPENSEIGYASSDTPPYEFLNYDQLTKAGAVLTKGAVGSFDDRLIESPCIWYDPKVGKLVMVYTAYEGQGELSEASASIGYAYSDDGVTWTKQGQFYVPSGVSGAPDENGLTGPVMVLYGGKYYFFYIGLTEVGYEAGTKTLCLAVGDSIEDFVNNTATRKGAMISPLGVQWTAQWYAGAVYHPTFIFKGGLWYCFFNASGKPIGKERIGFAVAESLEGPWNVNTKHLLDYIDESAVTVGQIAIDPSVVKMGTYFVMGYGFRLNDIGTFGDCWAFTEDCNFPYGWQYGGIGVKPSASGYDSGHAVKPFLLKHSGLVYHYYSAAGSEGNCIGLIK